jgi:hypothetical protein
MYVNMYSFIKAYAHMCVQSTHIYVYMYAMELWINSVVVSSQLSAILEFFSLLGIYR